MRASLTLLALVLVTTCSQPRTAPDSQANTAGSSIEIRYVMGHQLHEFQASASTRLPTARKLVDHHLIKESEINEDRYRALLTQVRKFLTAQSSSDRQPRDRQPSSVASCKMPYTITAKIDGQSRSATGCRLEAEGTEVGRLARDAEFLLYSSKDGQRTTDN